jgi:N-acetylneuraminic acid mutarotase
MALIPAFKRPALGVLVAMALWLGAALPAKADGAWTSGPTLLQERAETSAAVLDGRIYVAGGFTRDGADLASVEVLDPQVGTWQARAPLPLGLNHLSIAALGGVLYASGGSAGATPTSSFFAYDLTSDTWTPKTDLPLRRSAHVLVAAAGGLFVVGGVGDRAGVTLAYDPTSDTWQTRAPLPTLREHLAAAVLDDRIYVVGGRWADVRNLATLESYDPYTDTWQSLPAMPTARGGLTASFLRLNDGRLHVVGGEALDSSLTYGQHEVFDPSTGAWSLEADMPTPRHGLGSVGLNGSFFTLGGGKTSGLAVSDRTEVFTPR